MAQKIAIVTGAASGIGKAIAETLADGGAKVVVSDVNVEAGQAAAMAVDGLFVAADLAQRDQCRRLVGETVDRFGRVDILVNNAGFQHIAPIEDFPEDAWDALIAVMLTAPFLLTKYAWPHMKAQGWGRIVNMGSIHSVRASPFKVGYISAKHGLLGLTRTAAREGGPYGITVNAILPSYVRTPLVENQIADQALTHDLPEEEVVEKIMLTQTAIKRLIEPDEVAALTAFLCSDAAKAVTGAAWNIDAGTMAG